MTGSRDPPLIRPGRLRSISASSSETEGWQAHVRYRRTTTSSPRSAVEDGDDIANDPNHNEFTLPSTVYRQRQDWAEGSMTNGHSHLNGHSNQDDSEIESHLGPRRYSELYPDTVYANDRALAVSPEPLPRSSARRADNNASRVSNGEQDESTHGRGSESMDELPGMGGGLEDLEEEFEGLMMTHTPRAPRLRHHGTSFAPSDGSRRSRGPHQNVDGPQHTGTEHPTNDGQTEDQDVTVGTVNGQRRLLSTERPGHGSRGRGNRRGRDQQRED